MLTKQEMSFDQQQSILHIRNARQLQDTNYDVEDVRLQMKEPQGFQRLEQKLQENDFKEKIVVFSGIITIKPNEIKNCLQKI